MVVVGILTGMIPVEDPITAILTRDWAAVGGWSLFVTLCILIVVGYTRELIVPGSRLKRVEKLLEDANTLVHQQSEQIGKLVEGNQLTQYVMSQVAPIPRPRRKVVADSDHEAVAP